MKHYPGYKSIKTAAGRPVYVREESYDLFSRVLKEHRRSYHFTTILRTVMRLNAGGPQGKSLNFAGDAKSIVSGNVRMRYVIYDGAVFIETLVLMKPGPPMKTGLYAVTYDKDALDWLPSERPVKGPDITQQWGHGGDKAHYAAVAGRFDDLVGASRRLPEHIIGAYQKANRLTKSGAGTSYSLFWSEKGAHKSENAAQSLASVMQQSTQNSLPVNWLVHDYGVRTFLKAAKILKSSPLASAAAIAKNPNAGKVTNQNVYFSNPASDMSKKALERVCQDAGLTFVGLNTNNRDLRRRSTQINVGMKMGKLAAYGTLAGGGASKLVQDASGAAGFSNAINGVFNGLSSGDYAMIAAGAAAVGFAAHGRLKRSKVVAAGIICTFGKGNQEWYTDDDALVHKG